MCRRGVEEPGEVQGVPVGVSAVVGQALLGEVEGGAGGGDVRLTEREMVVRALPGGGAVGLLKGGPAQGQFESEAAAGVPGADPVGAVHRGRDRLQDGGPRGSGGPGREGVVARAVQAEASVEPRLPLHPADGGGAVGGFVEVRGAGAGGLKEAGVSVGRPGDHFTRGGGQFGWEGSGVVGLAHEHGRDRVESCREREGAAELEAVIGGDDHSVGELDGVRSEILRSAAVDH